MRAAPGRAFARRVIARISRRVGITFALEQFGRRRSRIQVNLTLNLAGGTVLLAEEPDASQDHSLRRQHQTAALTFLPSALLRTTSVTPISSDSKALLGVNGATPPGVVTMSPCAPTTHSRYD